MQAAYEAIANQVDLGLPFDDLPFRLKREIPWLLYYKPENGKPLGYDRGFKSAFQTLLECASRQKPRLVSALIMTLLRVYPKDTDLFPEWLALADGALGSTEGVRVLKWQDRNRGYGILKFDGPKRVARQFATGGQTFEELAEALGLAENLRGTNFMNECLKECLILFANNLDARSTIQDLVPIYDLLLDAQGKLRSDSIKSLIQESLLMPWASQKPSKEVQESLQKFLLQQFGDPRTSHNWTGTRDEAVAVIRKWIVGQTIGAFFGIIRLTANQDQWEYRQKFWNAYLRRDFIDDAWVVLGEAAARRGWSLLDRQKLEYGHLEKGYLAHPDQSVLIIRIGSILITEGSHNWKCRLWSDNSRTLPKMYAKRYSRSDLVEGADYEQVHSSPSTYTWQGSIARFLHSHTGRHVSLSEYKL